ncbi:hypothetical protein [Laspinema olomoucense]|uniref:hypothetical protein n=1 Tax=Laspinema olomoucense TaxID=3231600 RepID=UPI0021BA9A24|nr:hypothetical protein [Laspinema sp. D3d]MCT7971010.1 hypothetical protein [Laspinema sp. D3d]
MTVRFCPVAEAIAARERISFLAQNALGDRFGHGFFPVVINRNDCWGKNKVGNPAEKD